MFNILSQITLKVKFLRNEEQHCLLPSLVDDFTCVHSKNALLTHILSTLFSSTSVFFSCTPFGTKSYIYADSQTRHIGLFQIPCLGLCPLSTDQKLSLISLARYAISGQSDTETNSSSKYMFVRTQFKSLSFLLLKYGHFIWRQGATDYKVQGSDLKGGKYCLIVQKLRQLMLLFHCPDAILQYMVSIMGTPDTSFKRSKISQAQVHLENCS